MNDLTDKLSEAKESIRLELKRLSDRESQLNDKLGGLEAYVAHLEGLLEKANRASSNRTLEEVVRLGQLRTAVRPGFFKMSKYAIKKEVEEKLSSARKELNELLSEREEIEHERAYVNVCPDCEGTGKIRDKRYVRDDGIVRPVISVKQCSLCEGKGRID